MKIFEVFKILKADAQVSNLLADRIYEDLAPDGTPTPYLIWIEVSGAADNNLDSGAVADHLELQFMIYDPLQVTASSIRSEVCRVLENHGYVNDRLGHHEPATKLFARGFSMSLWLNR